MKIEKLYTLSQFVDLMGNSSQETNAIGSSFINILNYNEFLKKPLKKEMFVNEVEMPEQLSKLTFASPLWDKWQEAQKKVIFDLEQVYQYGWDSKSLCDHYSTLGQLAMGSNGELILKNVKI